MNLRSPLSSGLFAFPTAGFVELLWLQSRVLGQPETKQARRAIDASLEPEEGLRQAFAAALAVLQCPARTPVVWVVPPDVAGVLCAPSAGSTGVAELPLPFPDQEIRRVELANKGGLSVTLWAHANWIALLEDISQALDLMPIALVSRAQWAVASLHTAPSHGDAAGMACVLDGQGADCYLHAFEPTGAPCRSTVLPGTAQDAATQEVVRREMGALTDLFGTPPHTAPAATQPGWACDHAASVKQLRRISAFQLPSIALAGKNTLLTQVWARFIALHVLVACALAGVLMGGMWWQQNRLAELTEQVDLLKPESVVVQKLLRDEDRLRDAAKAVSTFKQLPDARQPVRLLFDGVPTDAHVLRVVSGPTSMEFDLQYRTDSSPEAEAFSFSLPQFGPLARTDAGAGIAKYTLQTPVAPSGTTPTDSK